MKIKQVMKQDLLKFCLFSPSLFFTVLEWKWVLCTHDQLTLIMTFEQFLLPWDSVFHMLCQMVRPEHIHAINSMYSERLYLKIYLHMYVNRHHICIYIYVYMWIYSCTYIFIYKLHILYITHIEHHIHKHIHICVQ